MSQVASAGTVKIGLVCINTGMNVSRSRPDIEHLVQGTLSEANPETAKGWELLPYQTGLLQVYAQAHAPNPARYEFGIPVHRRCSVEAAVGQIKGFEIVGFSTYVWNIRHSLKIAKRLKQEQPETLIVFGGPQVPDRAEEFLRENPFVDLAVHGEGERVFLDILEAFPSNNWNSIPSISFLDRTGAFVHHPKGTRIQDLATIPPVYASGVFDPLLAANPNSQWMAPLESNRGCPFSCTFCDWGSATNSKVYKFDLENIYRELDWFGEKKIENVFCCDANYGMLPRDEEIAEYVSQVRQKTGYPTVFVTQNTKNSTERSYRIQKRLNDAGLNSGVTLSFQSLDPTTLRDVKRDNISIESFSELQHRYTQDGVPTYTDIILGLPGETYDSFVDGFSKIIAGGQHHYLFFYNCQLLPNAEIAHPEYVKKYGLISTEQEMVEVHSSIDKCRNEETREYVKTVVTTNSMPKDEWIKAKTFMWMSDLVYFGRLLQIPLVLMNELYKFEYGRSIEALTRVSAETSPVIASVIEFFHQKARDIQNGSWEYCPSEPWRNIVWPANQYAFITLVQEEKLGEFYEEAKAILLRYCEERVPGFDPAPIVEAIDFNRKLVRLPFLTSNLRLQLRHNLWGFYQGVLNGKRVPFEKRDVFYGVWRTRPSFRRFDDWLEYVIFCHNNKHLYLYSPMVLPSEVVQASNRRIFQQMTAAATVNQAEPA